MRPSRNSPSGAASASSPRWWQRAYRVALRSFPHAFRARWATEMEQTFVDRITAARANERMPWRTLGRELRSAVMSGIGERIHARGERPLYAASHHANSYHAPSRLLHMQDVRYAFRLLRRAPGFSLLTVLVLAGGLGISTFTFSFLHTAMIRALPLSGGERIVRLDAHVQGRQQTVDAADMRALQSSLHTVQQLAAYSGRDLIIGRDGHRQTLAATVSDPALFAIARTNATMGRGLIPSDAADGAEPVIVLSHRTWKNAFGSDSTLLGRHVVLDGSSTRVVGVMPEGFGFPVASGAWIPLAAREYDSAERGRQSVRLVARLADGISYDQASAEATVVMQRVLAPYDSAARDGSLRVAAESFPAAQIGEERTLVFTVLNVLAALILLLALVNVTNLLLARANERVRETAVRVALGASTGRLVMQGMWETIILCTSGGLLGTAGAAWGLSAITRWTSVNLPDNLAFWWVWQMDAVTLLSAGAFVTLAITVLGSVISLRTTRMNVREVIQDGSARSGSRRDARFSRILVATQVATVTVLMFFGVVGGVVTKRVVSMDPGFDTHQLLNGGISPPDVRYATPASRAALYRNAQAAMSAQDALSGVLLRNAVADKESDGGTFALRDARALRVAPTAHVQAVLGDLGTIGVRVLDGRALDASDDATRAPVVVISRSLALRLWNGRSPVGEQLRLTGAGDTVQFRTIVGVTSDQLYGNPLSRERSADAIYVPLLQHDAPYTTFVARYGSTEAAARTALLSSLAGVDPLLMPESVQPFDEALRKMTLIAVSVAKLFAACFGFALLLALVGTYGLMSRSIASRTREIGVRRALGATDAGVARLLLGQGGRQLGVGTLVALPLLVAIGLAVRHFFPIGGTLTTALAVGVSVSIVALVLGATWLPTRRVLRVPLSQALRTE